MRIEPITDLSTSRVHVVTEHNGERLLWPAKVYTNMSLQSGVPCDITLIVKHINQYWGMLSPQRQEKIFQQYKLAHTALAEVTNIKKLMEQLRVIVRDIYELQPWEEFDTFVRKYAKIRLPEEQLREAYGVDAPNTPQTYLKEEYIGLLVMLLELRVMLPIFGAHVAAVEKEVGSLHKERHVYKVLTMSRIMDCPYYQRYVTYVNTFVAEQDDQSSLAAVLHHMGTDVIPEYMTAISLVRRVVCCPLTDWSMPNAEPSNVISMIYNFIKNKGEQVGKAAAGGENVREKSPGEVGDSSSDNPDNLSRAEAFKIREPISAAQLETFSVYLMNIPTVVRKIEPNMPEAVLTTLGEQYGPLLINSKVYDPLDLQLVLVQWTLQKVVDPRSIPHLDWNATMAAIVSSAILLDYWGFPDLALLLMANHQRLPETTIAHSRRSQLTRDNLIALAELYPHYQMTKLKRDQRLSEGNADTLLKQNIANNIAIKEIDELTKLLGQFEWDLGALIHTNAFQRKTMLRGNVSQHSYGIPENIKNILASYVLHLKDYQSSYNPTTV